MLLLLILGASIALIAGFSAARTAQKRSGKPTPQATATSTGTPVPFRSYTDPDKHFTLSYPATWKAERVQTNAGGLPLRLSGAHFSKGSAAFTVVSGPAPPLPEPDAVAKMLDDALLGTMGARNISQPQPITIGGRTWIAERADTDKGRMFLASIDLNGQLYSLWYNAPQSEFTSDEARIFTPMRASFQFGR